MSFFYSFIGMLLHSIWQAGSLAFIFLCVQAFAKNIHPLQRRNLLYSLLSAQIVVSLFTFFIYFAQKDFTLITITNRFSLSWLHSYASIIFYFYSMVVLYKFLSVILQWNVFRKTYQKRLLKVSAALKIFTELKAYQLGIKRKVTVWYCNNIESPITFGFLKPMILLPFSLVNALSMQEVETIILHELAHIKSKDYLLNWLLLCMEIVYFFNPFVQLLTNKIKLEREKNCDSQVLDFNYNEILYAQTLLKIAQNTVAVKSFQLGAVNQTSQLLQRIQFFSSEENRAFKSYKLNMLVWLFIPILLLTTTLFIQKKQVASKPTMPSSKVIFAPFYKDEKLNTYFELPRVIDVATSEKVENRPENSPAIVEQEAINNNFTFNEKAIFEENILPVRYEEAADGVKEFLYNVETQEGKMTQSYKLVKRNNKWVLEPQWMIVETNYDSTKKQLIDTAFNVIDSIQ